MPSPVRPNCGMAFMVKGMGRGLSSCTIVGASISSLYVNTGTLDEPKNFCVFWRKERGTFLLPGSSRWLRTVCVRLSQRLLS